MIGAAASELVKVRDVVWVWFDSGGSPAMQDSLSWLMMVSMSFHICQGHSALWLRSEEQGTNKTSIGDTMITLFTTTFAHTNCRASRFWEQVALCAHFTVDALKYMIDFTFSRKMQIRSPISIQIYDCEVQTHWNIWPQISPLINLQIYDCRLWNAILAHVRFYHQLHSLSEYVTLWFLV